MKAKERTTGQLRCKARVIQQGWLNLCGINTGDVVEVDKAGVNPVLRTVWSVRHPEIHVEAWAWTDDSPESCPVIRLIAGTLESASDERSSIAGTLE